ncbi:class I SAM-dependent methyltransferase [Cupriavidus pauculus]|uniref:class I SAM-dependent methyltransferase n=1 Tax=Cupriavidus pauculus TaxID=82633 RepID=UPI00078297D9|nr:class I SAM-dependent methyltransferase [Cupriavidus pauculus]MBY4733124.1 class I SAM-dependent methyltransferase [Cupriavidus pauculus]
MMTYTAQDQINRKAWRSGGARRLFGALTGFTDPGEAGALASVADEVRGEALLDVGVGGGRTVPLLRQLSDNYTAVDYTAELVDVCKRNYPDVRVLHADARDLSMFDDESFALVMFSWNGIDAVDPVGRQAILHEFTRVLRPGGLLLFSTHNMLGPGYRENLLNMLNWPNDARNALDFGLKTARVIARLPSGAFNFVRHSRLNRQYDGFGLRVCAAHRFGIVIYYTELEAQKRALADYGLHTEHVFGNLSEHELNAGDDLRRVFWFHFVARKPRTT